jgi:hypothetical protein
MRTHIEPAHMSWAECERQLFFEGTYLVFPIVDGSGSHW